MIDELRFVQGAVAKKDIIPSLTHFCIENGRIKSYNGRIALSCPIALDLNVRPRAVPFMKAIRACTTEAALYMTTAGRLGIRAGDFRAFIECDEQPFPDVFPDGTMIECPDGFLDSLRLLAPFISEDASRLWSRGIHFEGRHAYATNNIVLVQTQLKTEFPIPCNIPEIGVLEALRINEKPEYLLMAQNHLTFFYKGDRWLRMQLIADPAPDLGSILQANWVKRKEMVDVPGDLLAALDTLAPFVDPALGAVTFAEGRVCTSPVEGEGASVNVAHTAAGAYSHAHMREWATIAKAWAPDKYPRPVPFIGDDVHGLIIGMRV